MSLLVPCKKVVFFLAQQRLLVLLERQYSLFDARILFLKYHLSELQSQKS